MKRSYSPEGGSETEQQERRSVRVISRLLEITAKEPSKLQNEDKSLKSVHQTAKGVSTAGRGFFQRDGLIYRRWIPPGQDEGEMSIDQLVLPSSCRKAVVQLAYTIPLAGHMRRKKMAQ